MGDAGSHGDRRKDERPGGGMRRLLIAAAGVLLCAGVVGCASHRLGNKSLRLRYGMSRPQARAAVGAPQEVIVRQQQGVMIETWKYLDGALVFHQSMLSSWTLESPDQLSPERSSKSSVGNR